MRSPSMTCEFVHAEGVGQHAGGDSASARRSSARRTGRRRPGHSRENNCQVARPRSRTPSSSVPPSRNLSSATVSVPVPERPAAGQVPPDPSGSDTIPSRVMNSMTMTLTMSPVGRCSPVHTGGTGPAHRGGRNPAGEICSGRAKALKSTRVGEYDVARDLAAGDREDLERVQPVPAAFPDRRSARPAQTATAAAPAPPAPTGTRWPRSGTARSVRTRARDHTGREPGTPVALSPAPDPQPHEPSPAASRRAKNSCSLLADAAAVVTCS